MCISIQLKFTFLSIFIRSPSQNNIIPTIIKFLTLLGYDPAKHSVKVEMLAGLTTFLTMSYILAVNPLILCETGMDKGAVFSATVIAAAIATLVMAFYAKMPFALASGSRIEQILALREAGEAVITPQQRDGLRSFERDGAGKQ